MNYPLMMSTSARKHCRSDGIKLMAVVAEGAKEPVSIFADDE